MDLDLETFLTALYVIVDDLYQSHIHPMMPARGRPPVAMRDSEVLCLALVSLDELVSRSFVIFARKVSGRSV